MIRFACLLLLGSLGLAQAQSDPARDAQLASDQLEAAVVSLDGAQKAIDRVAALTQTVKVFEDGMAAMRDGLRGAALREQTLRKQFEDKEGELSVLLTSMQRIGRASGPLSLLHPSGPLGTARAGMLVGDLTPALQIQADILKAELEEMTLLRELQEGATKRMQTALEKVQQARSDLSQAIADRTDLPKRFTEDPVQTALLISSTETLGAFASGLVDIYDTAETATFDDLQGALPLPVQGSLLRGFGEADAAGIARPGWIVATAPQAMVTSPTAATLRYHGELLDYGTVVILEPANDTLLVFVGLGQVFGQIGDVLPQGTPIGLMSGDAKLTTGGQIGGRPRPETLYIELRRGPEAVDPSEWFDLKKEQ